MAGIFTHWMVAEEALDRHNRLPRKHLYFPTIHELSHFVCLGATGPDVEDLSRQVDRVEIRSWESNAGTPYVFEPNREQY